MPSATWATRRGAEPFRPRATARVRGRRRADSSALGSVKPGPSGKGRASRSTDARRKSVRSSRGRARARRSSSLVALHRARPRALAGESFRRGERKAGARSRPKASVGQAARLRRAPRSSSFGGFHGRTEERKGREGWGSKERSFGVRARPSALDLRRPGSRAAAKTERIGSRAARRTTMDGTSTAASPHTRVRRGLGRARRGGRQSSTTAGDPRREES